MLSMLIFLPVLGGLIGWFTVIATQRLRYQLSDPQTAVAMAESRFFRLKVKWTQHCATWIALLTLCCTLLLLLYYWHLPIWHGVRLQYELNWPWIAFLGIRFHLLLDGFALTMVTLIIIIATLTIIYTSKEKHANVGLYYFCILWMTTGIVGLMLAADLFLFFLFWEMVSIPLYFIIVLWGRRESSAQLRFNGASKFLIFTQVSSILMLIAIISLAMINWYLTRAWSFDYSVLIKTPISSYTEWLLMLGFLAAFVVRLPLVPFHGWLIDAHTESSTSGSILISGLLINSAVYGMLRFVIMMFPNATLAFSPIAIGFGLLTLFYAALLSFNQKDIKRLITYVHIALMGFIVTLMYCTNLLTLQGIVLAIIAISLLVVGLFIISGLLSERFMTRNLRQFIGLRGRVSYLPAFTIFFALTALGVPGTANFLSNVMVLFGSYTQAPIVTVMLTIGLLLMVVALLIRMQPIFYSLTASTSANAAVIYRKLTQRDIFMLTLVLLLLFVIGCYPQFILDTTYPVMGKIQTYLDNAQSLLDKGAK